jgi:hypothetical protein
MTCGPASFISRLAASKRGIPLPDVPQLIGIATYQIPCHDPDHRQQLSVGLSGLFVGLNWEKLFPKSPDTARLTA